MKNTTLFCFILCYSGLIAGASAPQATLDQTQQAMRVLSLSSYLPPIPDIGRLSCVSKGVHVAVEPIIITAMEEAAKWESHVLNARRLDLSAQRENRNNQEFKDYVIQCIKDFATENPETWIGLDLSKNNLGNDVDFLSDLLQAIVATVHSLKIDLASLYLSNNELASLPEYLLEGLNNLLRLDLSYNQLTSLPEHFFDGLSNLEELNLLHNQLSDLPGCTFKDLKNLQRLDLGSNQLSNLHERIFKGLNNLQWLNLNSNLLKSLPEHIFGGLGNLQTIHFSFNWIWDDLPKGIFEGLNNLKLVDPPAQLRGMGILKILRARGVQVW